MEKPFLVTLNVFATSECLKKIKMIEISKRGTVFLLEGRAFVLDSEKTVHKTRIKWGGIANFKKFSSWEVEKSIFCHIFPSALATMSTICGRTYLLYNISVVKGEIGAKEDTKK